jgi:hypothetical protein
MRTTEPSGAYVAIWQEPDGSRAQGSLTLEPEALLLRGTGDQGRLAVRRLPFTELVGVRIGRAPDERLNGNPTLLLERRSGDSLRVSISGAGLLWELADLLALLVDRERERSERIVLVARLKAGMLERVRALVAEGPPFDPEAIGLERNELFLTDDAVIFVLEGRHVLEVVQRLVQEPGLWKAALDWDACLTGRPQLAEIAYSWSREEG